MTTPGPVEWSQLQAADAGRTHVTRDDPAFQIAAGPKTVDLHGHAIRNYQDLFSSRQLTYMHEARSLLEHVTDPVRLNLALLISTALEFNSLLCSYKGGARQRPGAIRHAFAYHAYSLPFTAVENNPIYPARRSGTLQNLFHYRLRRGRQWAQRPRERNLGTARRRWRTIPGEVDIGAEVSDVTALTEGKRRFLLRQGSATHLDLPAHCVDYIVTDPPYFDSVQYGDLATYFHVWLRQLLPENMNWDYDRTEAAVDPRRNGAGPYHYGATLAGIFRECRRVLKPRTGRLIFTFHHRKARGWAALTAALQAADFHLLNYYVVHAENPVSVHIANLNALVHDAILVLAGRDEVPAPDWPQPDGWAMADSHTFTANCGAALGWLLNARLAEGASAACWEGWWSAEAASS